MSQHRVLGVLLLSALAAALSAASVLAPQDETPPAPFNVTMVAPWACTGNNCKLKLVALPVKEGFQFSMEAEAKGYVAVAFAGTAMMGDSSVIECLPNSNGTIELYHSTNSGPPGVPGRANKRDPIQTIEKVAKNITGSYKDGRIHCSFILSPTTVFPKTRVDLKYNRYYLQIASGDVNENRTAILHHTRWATTLRSISLIRNEGKLRTVDNAAPVSTGKSAANTLTTSSIVFTTLLLLKALL